jgi:hypothetical protein
LASGPKLFGKSKKPNKRVRTAPYRTLQFYLSESLKAFEAFVIFGHLIDEIDHSEAIFEI